MRRHKFKFNHLKSLHRRTRRGRRFGFSRVTFNRFLKRRRRR